MVSGILVARLLGVNGRGQLALFALLPTVIGIFGSLGLPLAAAYFIARAPTSSAAVVTRLRRPVLAQALILVPVHALLLGILIRHDSAGVKVAAAITLIGVPTVLAQQYGLAILQGLRLFRPFNFLRVSSLLGNALALAALFLVGDRSLVLAMLSYIGTSFVSGAITLIVAMRAVARTPSELPSPSVAEMARFGTRALVGSSSPIDAFKLDQAVIGLFLSPGALGIYVTGLAFTNLPKFVSQSIGMIAYPHLANQRAADQARRSMWRFIALTMALSAAIVAALELLVGLLLPFMFGQEFVSAVPIARILLIAAFFISCRRIASDGARGIGRPGLGSIAEVTSWVSLIPSLAILAPIAGIRGVAIALVIGSAISLTVLLVFLRTDRLVARFTDLITLRRLAGWAGTAGALVAVCAALGYVLSLTGRPNWLSAPGLWGIATLVVALAPLVLRIVKRSLDVFEPIVPAAIMLGLLFGTRPLAMLVSGNTSFLGYDSAPTLSFATMLGFVGTLAFVVGYEVHRGRVRSRVFVAPPAPPVLRLRVVRMFGIIVSVLGVVLFAAHLMQGGGILSSLQLLSHGRSVQAADTLRSGSTEYLSASPVLLACVCIVMAVAIRRPFTGRERIVALLLVAVPVMAFALNGNRRFILPSIIVPIVARYLFLGRRPPRKLLIVVGPIAFIIFATIPFERAAGAREQAGGATAIFVEAFQRPGEPLGRFLNGPDTAMLPSLAAEVQLLQHSGGYGFGKATFGDLLLAPIPSAVFHNKPTTARNDLLIRLFGQPCEAVGGGKCPDFSAVGTFYQDFWVIGVLVGMLLLGLGSAAAWCRLQRRPRDPTSLVLVATIAVFLPIMLRAGFMPPAAWTLYFLVPSLVGVWIARSRPVAQVARGQPRVPGWSAGGPTDAVNIARVRQRPR